MSIRWLAGLLMLALGGCATQQEKISLAPSVRSVAIIASLPEKVELTAIGLTRLHYDDDAMDAAPWQLDVLSASIAKETLAPRFPKVTTDVVPNVSDKAPPIGRAFGAENTIVTWVREHAATYNADLYVVINGSYKHGHILPRIFNYVGLSARKNILATEADVYAHTTLGVTILDGHTFAVLADVPLLTPDGSTPITQLKDFQWVGSWAEMTEAQLREVRAALETLLKESIPYTLGRVLGQ